MYADRQTAVRGMIDKGDLCYKLFTENGFLWGGDFTSVKDYQHFEYVGGGNGTSAATTTTDTTTTTTNTTTTETDDAEAAGTDAETAEDGGADAETEAEAVEEIQEEEVDN